MAQNPPNFNDTVPAAPTGTVNIKWQADAAGPNPSVPRKVSAYFPNMIGDSGSGGTAGAVPAPASGDSAANKFLKADATWETPSLSLDSDVDITSPSDGDVLTYEFASSLWKNKPATGGGGGGGTGSLSIASTSAPSTVNLTTEGTYDWWVVTGTASGGAQLGTNAFVFKPKGGALVPNTFKAVVSSHTGMISTSASGAASGGPVAFSASAGDAFMPLGNGSSAAIPPSSFAPYLQWTSTDVGFGFTFAVDANSVSRTLKLYLGVGAFSSNEDVTVTAHLMDGSASDVSTVCTATFSGSAGVGFEVTITFQSANPTKLVVSSIVTAIANAGFTGTLAMLGMTIS